MAWFGRSHHSDLGVTVEKSPLHSHGLLLTLPGTNSDGPADSLAEDGGGNFYATGSDTVFELTQPGFYLNLHNFTGRDQGLWNGAAVILDSDGYLYGTAGGGTSPNCPAGCGMVYMIRP
jgi:hypothetical protein